MEKQLKAFLSGIIVLYSRQMFCKKLFIKVERKDSLKHIFSSILFTSLCNGSKRFLFQFCKTQRGKIIFFFFFLTQYQAIREHEIEDLNPKPRSPGLSTKLNATASCKHRATALLIQRDKQGRFELHPCSSSSLGWKAIFFP